MNKRKIFSIIIFAIVFLGLLLILFLVKQQTNINSHAAAPDQLETEGGVLGGNAIVKQDTNASGGNYVAFANQIPTPTNADVTVQINKNQIDTTSKFEVGVTQVWGGIGISGLDPTAKQNAINLLSNGVKYENRHIYGFGLTNPNPSPGVYNWTDLDKAMEIIKSTGGTPVITLCCSPGWMTSLGTTNDTSMNPNYAPTPTHFADFANLARQVALRYPEVKYYQVWNELKGFNWDITSYTNMYNMVYDSLKSVDPTIKVGGPYMTLISGTDAVPVPQWILDDFKYWFANKHGADFVNLDYSVVDFNATTIPTSEQIISKTGNFDRIITQIKSVQGYNKEPLWWAEDYALSNQKNLTNMSDDAQAAFLASMLNHEMRSGSTTSLRWSPAGDNSITPQSNIESLFTDPRVSGGSLAYPAYYVYKAFNDYFKPGTAIYNAANSDPNKIEIIPTATKTMIINKTSTSLTVAINGQLQTIDGFKVLVINTP